MLEKVARIKRFESSPLGSELKKQYQGLNTFFESDKKEETVAIKKEKPAMADKSKLIYNSKYSFSDYSNVRKCYDLSFMTKYDKLLPFYHRLNEFRKFNPRTEKLKIKKKSVYKNVVKLFNTLLAIYFNEYNNITDEEKEKMDEKYDPSNLFFKDH